MILNEITQPLRLGDLAKIGLDMPDADFWIIRRGPKTEVGRPVTEYDAERIGVKVVRTDVLVPQYLRYMLEYQHNLGVWEKKAVGTTRLVNIRVSDIANITLG